MISDFIRWEGVALLSSVFWGMVYAGIYDCIRIFRRILKHRKVWMIFIEDIIFWIYVGINVFCITFQLNDGVVRGFSLAGYVLGALLYHYTLGRLLVKYVTKLILFILKPLKKLARLIKIGLNKLVAAGKRSRLKHKEQSVIRAAKKKEQHLEQQHKKDQQKERERQQKAQAKEQKEYDRKLKAQAKEQKEYDRKLKAQAKKQTKDKREHTSKHNRG